MCLEFVVGDVAAMLDNIGDGVGYTVLVDVCVYWREMNEKGYLLLF